MMGKPVLAWKRDVTLDSGIVVEDAVRSIVRFEFDEVRQFCTMFWEGWVSEAVFDAQGPDEPSMSGSFTFDDGPLTIVVDAETIGPAIFTTHVYPAFPKHRAELPDL